MLECGGKNDIARCAFLALTDNFSGEKWIFTEEISIMMQIIVK